MATADLNQLFLQLVLMSLHGSAPFPAAELLAPLPETGEAAELLAPLPETGELAELLAPFPETAAAAGNTARLRSSIFAASSSDIRASNFASRAIISSVWNGTSGSASGQLHDSSPPPYLPPNPRPIDRIATKRAKTEMAAPEAFR